MQSVCESSGWLIKKCKIVNSFISSVAIMHTFYEKVKKNTLKSIVLNVEEDEVCIPRLLMFHFCSFQFAKDLIMVCSELRN